MIKSVLTQAIRENVISHGYDEHVCVNVFSNIIDALHVDNIISVAPAHQMAQPYQQLEQISMTLYEVISNVILCNRNVGLYIYHDELMLADTWEFVGKHIGAILHREIMDDIYLNGGVLNFRLDLEDDSPLEIINKLREATTSSKNKFGWAMMFDKWILPTDVIDAILPFLYDSFGFQPSQIGGGSGLYPIGNYQGIEIFCSYTNTVALLCYKDSENNAGEVLMPYTMTIEDSPEFCGYRIELIYGLKNINPDFFVSLQVR